MASQKEESYQPLNPTSRSDSMSEFEFDHLPTKRVDKKGNLCKMSLLFVLALLLVGSNGIWLWRLKQHKPNIEALQPNYYNSTITKLKPYHWNTGFGSSDKNKSSELWAGLFPSGEGLVSVPRSWAALQQLPDSKNPENAVDDTNSIYLVAVLHNLHCLTVLRASLYHYKEGTEQGKSWYHLMHCLDSIRQSLMCSMDDTLMYTENGIQYGDGQVRQCRDWDAMVSWVEEHALDTIEAHPPLP